MKIIRGFAMAAALLAISATAVAAAPAASSAHPANRQVQDFCHALIASGTYPTLNLGECVSFNVTSDQGFVTKFCDFLRETDGYADYGFTSFSDCVRSSR